ncbi:MAG: hypothetical protein LIO45_05535, partial [Clostridiales bacterium]|nr:hypothetical protein [Clostridiales bacterium]
MKKARMGISMLILLAALLLTLGSPALASTASITYYADASASDGESTAYRYVKIGSSTVAYTSHIYNQHTDFKEGSTIGGGSYQNGRNSGCGYCVLAIAYNLLGYQLDGADLAALSYDTARNNLVTAEGASLGYRDGSYRK